MPSRISKILCPVDFSGASTRAFHHALAIASWYGAEVTVLHVHRTAVPLLRIASLAGAEAPPPPPVSNLEREQLTDDLRAFVSTERRLAVEVTWLLDEAPDVCRAITSRAGALDADLIVIGTHGRSGVRRLILGSIAEHVLRTAECPVLTVPPGASNFACEPLVCSRVVCATDFSAASARALECAVSIAHRAKAALTVAHIVELPPEVPHRPDAHLSDYRTARFDEARAEMAHALKPYRDVPRIDELILAGRASREILRLAAEQQAEVIVMGVQGRDSIDVLIFGSVTNHVVRQATCPVLIITARMQPWFPAPQISPGRTTAPFSLN